MGWIAIASVVPPAWATESVLPLVAAVAAWVAPLAACATESVVPLVVVAAWVVSLVEAAVCVAALVDEAAESVAAFAVGAAEVVACVTGSLPLLAGAVPLHTLALFDSFYRSGALVFGGGHVVLPLLQASVVPPGWVTMAAPSKLAPATRSASKACSTRRSPAR